MPKQSTNWKNVERTLARAYGAERNLDQNREGGGPDFYIRSPLGGWKDALGAHALSAEVKHRGNLAVWLERALAKGDVVFLHEKGQRFDNCVVLMRRELLDVLLEAAEVAYGVRGIPPEQ